MFERARLGDKDALTVVFRAFQPALLRYLRGRLPDAAEDMAAHAFHAMVTISFGLHSFYAYTLCYLVFVDWPTVAEWCRRATQRFPPRSQRARGPT